MKPYVSNGNLKMNIPTFNLPAGRTCPGSTPTCRRFCYAKKAERSYPNVLPCRMRNYEISMSYDFTTEMSLMLFNKKNLTHLRIHESGDFYSQPYLEKWFELCRMFPHVQFLVFTQSYRLDFSNKPPNLVIYWSVWPDSSGVPDEGLFAYAGIDKGVHQCRKKCDDCMHCFNGESDVQFKIH